MYFIPSIIAKYFKSVSLILGQVLHISADLYALIEPLGTYMVAYLKLEKVVELIQGGVAFNE